jgi:hypothetical protein
LCYHRHKLLVERLGNGRWGCSYVARAVAFARIGQKGKLAHHKDFAIGIDYASVHLPVLVIENAQLDQLTAHPGKRGSSIGRGKASQGQQAWTNAPGNLSFDGHLSFANALNDKTHNKVVG